MTASYDYDALGRRNSKIVNGTTSRQVWDGDNVIYEADGNWNKVASYYRGTNLVAIDNGVIDYYLYNSHGDVVGMKNEESTIVYDAFGNQKQDTTESYNPFRYNGQYTDEETGLIYLRARYYDPATGRFVSQDTHWNPENMIYGDDVENKVPDISAMMQSGNLYAYCMSNPVMLSDPLGTHTQNVPGEVDGGMGVIAVREDLRKLLADTNGVLKIEGRTIYIKALGGAATLNLDDYADTDHFLDNHLHFTYGEFFELLGLQYEKQSMRVNVTEDEYRNASMKYEIQKWGISQVSTIFGMAIEGGIATIFDSMTNFLDAFWEDPYATPDILPPGTYHLNQYTIQGKIVLQQRIKISAGNSNANSYTSILSWNPDNPDYFYDIYYGWQYPL